MSIRCGNQLELVESKMLMISPKSAQLFKEYYANSDRVESNSYC